MELKSWIEATRNGDLDAYGRIVKRFQDMAYGLAYAALGDFHLAQDAAQEAFIEAHRQLRNLREERAFPGWFRRIVVGRCHRMIRERKIATQPLETALHVAADAPPPSEAAANSEQKDAALTALRALPEAQRRVTTLYYIGGHTTHEIAAFLGVPITAVKKRLHDSRNKLKEKMIEMLTEKIRSHALPAEFASTVVRLVASKRDVRYVTEFLPHAGPFKSVADAKRREMFVVEERGQIASAGHFGETVWSIGSATVKAARSGAGIAGESEGVPDSRFVKGYRAHFELARERGIHIVFVHGSQYDHAFCGFVPCFYYPVSTLAAGIARTIQTRVVLRKANRREEEAARKAWLRDPYAPKMSAYIGGGIAHVIEEGSEIVGYARVNPDYAPADRCEMPFGFVTDVTVRTRDAALAVIRTAGELAARRNEADICLMQSHVTLIGKTMLGLGGAYLLRGPCPLPGLDSEMVRIIDLAGLSADLREEFDRRLDASSAGDVTAALSIEMDGETVGFKAETGGVRILKEKQPTHLVLPRWVVTRLYMGYHSAEEVMTMGPLPPDLGDSGRPSDLKRDLRLPKNAARLFVALFPKLWPCAWPDPDVWPWVIGKAHPRYQHEEKKTPEMKARIDALRFPWVGY